MKSFTGCSLPCHQNKAQSLQWNGKACGDVAPACLFSFSAHPSATMKFCSCTTDSFFLLVSSQSKASVCACSRFLLTGLILFFFRCQLYSPFLGASFSLSLSPPRGWSYYGAVTPSQSCLPSPCSHLFSLRFLNQPTTYGFCISVCGNHYIYKIPFFSLFLRPHLHHMKVPRLGVKSELQPQAYTIATSRATLDPSCICDLHSSLQ